MLPRAPWLFIAFVIALSWLVPTALAEPNTPEPIPTASVVLPAPAPSESTVLPGAMPTESAGIPVPISASATTPPGGPEGVPAAPEAWGIWAPNLLDYGNGNAEDGAGATDSSSTVAVPKWTVHTGTMTAVRYGTPNFPTAAQDSCGNPGLNLFAGGPNSTLSGMGQDWAPTYQSEWNDIDTGVSTYTLAGCFGGRGAENDNAWLEIGFYSGTGSLLGYDSVGRVTAADRGSQTKLLYRSKSGRVPAGTRTMHLNLLSQGDAGSYNDGYADNLRLSLRRPAYVYLPLLMRPASPPPRPPTAPANLTCDVASISQINLQWQDISNNEDGFRVERAIGSGSFQEIRTTGAGIVQAQITGLTADTDYRFRVRAYNAGGTSSYSNVCSGHTPAPQPSILRVVNNSAHPIVSLVIDGQEQIFNTATSIGTSSYKDYAATPGAHTCMAYNGFYQNNGLPFTMYGWGCNWTQPTGQTYTLTLNNHTIQQILSYYSTAAYWGSTCLTSNGIDFNECGICFYGNGKYQYLRGPLFSAPAQMTTIQSGTYGSEAWGSLLVDFSMVGGVYTHSAYYQDYNPGVYVRAPHTGMPTPMDSAYIRKIGQTCPASP